MPRKGGSAAAASKLETPAVRSAVTRCAFASSPRPPCLVLPFTDPTTAYDDTTARMDVVGPGQEWTLTERSSRRMRLRCIHQHNFQFSRRNESS